MPYKPFPIADLRAGLELDREPWLGHPAAWRTMRNAYVYQGRLVKRGGYVRFGELGRPRSSQGNLAGSNAKGTAGAPFSITLTAPLEKGTLRIRDTAVHCWTAANGNRELSDDGAGNVTHPVDGNVGTINYATGALVINGLSVAFDSTAVRYFEFREVVVGSIGDGTAGSPATFRPNMQSAGLGNKPTVRTSVVIEDGINYIEASGTHLKDDGAGKIVKANDGTEVGTIEYVLDLLDAITINGLSVAFGADCWLKYLWREPVVTGISAVNMVMAMDRFVNTAQLSLLTAADRRRSHKYDEAQKLFLGLTFNDLWTCEPEDFFWTAQFPAHQIVTNGKDPVCYFDGVKLFEMHTDWTAPSSKPPDFYRVLALGDTNIWAPVGMVYARKVDSAKLAFRYHERTVLLGTKEGGTIFPTRARWSKVAPNFTDGATWDPNDFTDAPTSDVLVTAGFIGDTIFALFEKSVWKLVWKDDFRKPFEWVHVSDLEGALGRKSVVKYREELVALGPTSLVGVDGGNVYKVGKTIPDLPLTWNQEVFDEAFAHDMEVLRQAWLTYADVGDANPQHVLVNQYEDSAFSIFDMPAHCFGEHFVQTVKTVDQITTLVNLYLLPPDARSASAGFPTYLMGDYSLFIWELFNGFSDNDSDIELELLGNRLNPWAQEGSMQRARLGWIDILGAAGASVQLTLRLYADHDDAAYKTVTFTLEPPLGQQKTITRIPVNRTARWHRWSIEETGKVPVVIDAIVPWMQPAGFIRSDREPA